MPLARAVTGHVFVSRAAKVIGRDKELGQLRTLVNTAKEKGFWIPQLSALANSPRTGEGCLVLLEGEQGHGKSLVWETLVRELDITFFKGAVPPDLDLRNLICNHDR